MRILLDTNILIRYNIPESSARTAVRRAIESGSVAMVVPQVLTEYWAVATRPIEANGLGLAIEVAALEIGAFTKQFELVHDSPACYFEWEKLVKRYGVKGKQAHNAKVAAAMIAHGIGAILTFNAVDFERFSEIETLAP